MKKSVLMVLAATALFANDGMNLSVKAGEKDLTPTELQALKGMSPVLGGQGLTIQKAIDRKDLNIYQIRGIANTPNGEMPIEMFLDKTTKTVFFGAAYDSTGKKLTIPAPPAPPVNVETVKAGVAFTYGKGEKEIFLMTDPECPFCQKLEAELGKKIEDGYKVHVVLFPLSFHLKAIPMVQYVLKGKTEAEKATRLKEMMSGKEDIMKEQFKSWNTPEYQKDYQEYKSIVDGTNKDWKKYFESEKELNDLRTYLSKSTKAFKESGAKGTPNIFDGKTLKEINPGAL